MDIWLAIKRYLVFISLSQKLFDRAKIEELIRVPIVDNLAAAILKITDSQASVKLRTKSTPRMSLK